MKEEENLELRLDMIQDFEDQKVKFKGWKTVRGEVEVETEKVEICYREKVIELPRHRQQETGIKRIRRRELLPPIPEDFYIPAKEFRGQVVVAEQFVNGKSEKTYKYNETDFPPTYSFNAKFDEVYKFLTDGTYPAPNTLVHVMNWAFGARIIGHGLVESKKDQEDIRRFKDEGMYFQEIYVNHPTRHTLTFGEKRHFYVAYGEEPYVRNYATPVFIFGQKNKNFTDYLNAIGASPHIFKSAGRGLHTHFPLNKGLDIPKLLWCHADAAIIPTSRGLNALFFEGSYENKP